MFVSHTVYQLERKKKCWNCVSSTEPEGTYGLMESILNLESDDLPRFEPQLCHAELSVTEVTFPLSIK